METGPQEPPVLAQASSPPGITKNNLIAPVWHTVVIVLLILGYSFLGSAGKSNLTGPNARILVYSSTLVVELILFLFIWFGIRRRGFSMRELIGGRWETVESFLLDVGLAVGFLLVCALILTGLRVALGTLDLHNTAKQLEDTKRMLGPLIPRSKLEAGLFVALSVFAGVFEEIIFRGYFQRQLSAMARSATMAIVGSGILFGLAHAYQGGRMMIVIGVFGVLFGLLAHFRKSLRPGIIAHAIQDTFSGLALFFLFR